MNKQILKLIVPLFAIVLFASLTSAYYYGDEYKKEYTVKETYDDYGYTYYQKSVDQNPWGEVTTYKKIKDYDTPNSFYRDPYRNRVLDYWNDGPYHGYSSVNSKRYLGYGWDDSYRRNVYDTQYHSYYYEPRHYYQSDYYNWQGNNEPSCSGRYCYW